MPILSSGCLTKAYSRLKGKSRQGSYVVRAWFLELSPRARAQICFCTWFCLSFLQSLLPSDTKGFFIYFNCFTKLVWYEHFASLNYFSLHAGLWVLWDFNIFSLICCWVDSNLPDEAIAYFLTPMVDTMREIGKWLFSQLTSWFVVLKGFILKHSLILIKVRHVFLKPIFYCKFHYFNWLPIHY